VDHIERIGALVRGNALRAPRARTSASCERLRVVAGRTPTSGCHLDDYPDSVPAARVAADTSERHAPVCVGFLQAMGARTLNNTLHSWAPLLRSRMVARAVIFFQQYTGDSEWDRWRASMAAHYNLTVLSDAADVGMRSCARMARECLDTPLFMCVEEDFVLTASLSSALRQLQLASMLLAEHACIDAVMFRSCSRPGKPYFSRARWDRTHTIDETGTLYYFPWLPRAFWEARNDTYVCASSGDAGIVCSSSAHTRYSNNPVLYRTHWYMQTLYWTLHALGVRAIENELNGLATLPTFEKSKMGWWRVLDFPIAYSFPGLFTHDRLDRLKAPLNATPTPSPAR